MHADAQITVAGGLAIGVALTLLGVGVDVRGFVMLGPALTGAALAVALGFEAIAA